MISDNIFAEPAEPFEICEIGRPQFHPEDRLAPVNRARARSGIEQARAVAMLVHLVQRRAIAAAEEIASRVTPPQDAVAALAAYGTGLLDAAMLLYEDDLARKPISDALNRAREQLNPLPPWSDKKLRTLPAGLAPGLSDEDQARWHRLTAEVR